MSIQTNLFINNEYIPSQSTESLTIYNPHDESLVASDIQAAGQADVDAAVSAARAAFKGPWAKTSAREKSRIMLRFADLIDEHKNEIGELEARSMGMPVAVTGRVVGVSAEIWRYYAGWTDKLSGEQYPELDGNYRILQYEPLGVCAGIGAWNASTAFFGFKTAPAVAMGNTVIYKGSEKSPLGLLYLGALVKEAGFPPGVINIITGDGRAGSMLASHMDINKISFTGSAFAGKKVQELSAKSNLKRCTLELGGKSPSLIFEDADIENALQHHSQNFLFNTGQVCVAASRTFVQESIAPKFVEQLKARFEQFSHSIGSPLDPKTYIGPLADRKQFDRVMEFLKTGQGEAELITGGKRHGESGYYVEPTIFLNPGDDARIYREEIFGPVVTIRTFKDEEEGVRMANYTAYGLSACVFTASTGRALRVAKKLEAGMVNINTSQAFGSDVPFGGSKQSGTGREGGRHGLMAYVEPKLISINMAV